MRRGAVSAGSRPRRSTRNARGGGLPRLRERSRNGRELAEAALPQARDESGRVDGPLSRVWGPRSVRLAPGRGTAAPVVLGCAVRDVRGPWSDSGLVAPRQVDHALCVTASFPVMVPGAPATILCSLGGCRGVTIQSGLRPSSQTPERRGDPRRGSRPLRPPERARFRAVRGRQPSLPRVWPVLACHGTLTVILWGGLRPALTGDAPGAVRTSR